MGIFNAPLWFVRPLAKIFSLCPKRILSLRYYKATKHFINWKAPRNIQEFSCCQLFDKETDVAQLARLADKVAVRDYVQASIGEQYLTQLFGVWTSPEDIDFEALPHSFVLKTNNGCASNIIVKDKTQIDVAQVRQKLTYWLKFPYGDLTGQIHYSKIKPLILAENFLRQSTTSDILPYDYKFFCYKGEPKYILFYEGRSVNGHLTPNMLYDLKWQSIPYAVVRPIDHEVPKPASLDEMIMCVRKLCKGFEFVRVDFYEIDQRPVFGEMTFTPDILTNIKSEYVDLMQLHSNRQ